MRKAVLGFVALVLLACSGTAFAQQPPVPSDSRLRTVLDKKVIRVAYRSDATPFSFVNDKKEPVGYSIDLCQLVVSSIEQQYGASGLKIEWVPVTVHTRFAAIAEDKADIECGSSTVSLGRMEEVDFSNAIFVESTGVIVARASNIRTFSDMNGKRIATVAGTTNERAVMDEINRRKLDMTLLSVKDRDEGVAALEAGSAAGFASNKLLLLGAQTRRPQDLAMLPDDLSIESYAIALPRGDWAFRLAVNGALARIYRGGGAVEVFRRWFDQIGLQPGLLIDAAYALGGLPD